MRPQNEPRLQDKERLSRGNPEQHASRLNVGLAELVAGHPATQLDEIHVRTDIAHRLVFPARHRVPEHLHPFFEFTYVLEGQMYYTVGERPLRIGSGHGFVIPPNHVHGWETREAGVTVFGIMASVTPTHTDPQTLGYRLDQAARSLGHRLKLSPALRGAVHALLAETGQQAPWHRHAAARYLDLTVLHSFRALRAALPEQPGAEDHHAAIPGQKLLLAAKGYAEANLASGVNAQDLARHLGVSTRHLARVFQAHETRTTAAFLQELRLQRAKRLLKEGRYPVKAVAGMCGFRDLGYFSRFFRQQTGHPPTSIWRAIP